MRWRRSDRDGSNSAASSDPGAPATGVEPAGIGTRLATGTAGPASIWVGTYRSREQWHAAADHRDAMFAVMDHIDDRLLSSRHRFDLPAWCSVCQAVRAMAITWSIGAIDQHGSVNPAWTETADCTTCGLNSRMRAFVSLIRSLDVDVTRAFIAERVTGSFPVIGELVPGLVGAEFLGADRTPGVEYDHGGVMVRHEDITALTFDDDSFDLVMSQDVIEHVFDYEQAFRECRRVLRPGGAMVFTIPFAGRDQTRVLASVDDAGEIRQIVEPPEIHGNPVGDGSLCFHHFGWDVLDSIRSAGFAEAVAHQYWAPWAGHLGLPTFVFEAR